MSRPRSRCDWCGEPVPAATRATILEPHCSDGEGGTYAFRGDFCDTECLLTYAEYWLDPRTANGERAVRRPLDAPGWEPYTAYEAAS